MEAAGDLRMTDSHSCKAIREFSAASGFRVAARKDRPEDGMISTWHLIHESLATTYEVKFGEADKAGEVTAEIRLAISFCPFCGTKLD